MTQTPYSAPNIVTTSGKNYLAEYDAASGADK